MDRVDPDVFAKCVALAESVVSSDSVALIGLDAVVSISVVDLMVVVVSIVYDGLDDVISTTFLELMLLFLFEAPAEVNVVNEDVSMTLAKPL